MKIAAAYVCAQGNVRTRNQDNLYFRGKVLALRHSNAQSRLSWDTSTKKAVCMGVFDGMGGEQYGETASLLAAETLKARMREDKSGKIPGEILSAVCHLANQMIYQKTLELKADRIGSTAAVIYMQYDRIWCCNVGDSRIYRLRGGSFEQISCDHTALHPQTGQKRGLTQHLGMNPQKDMLLPYIVDGRMEEGDFYLLCSDGLTDMVPPEEIKSIMRQNTSVRKCSRALLKCALENGGRDNVTAVVFRVK